MPPEGAVGGRATRSQTARPVGGRRVVPDAAGEVRGLLCFTKQCATAATGGRQNGGATEWGKESRGYSPDLMRLSAFITT